MAKAGLSDLRVMIVDDQSSMRSIVRSLLKQVGLTTTVEAENGVAALEYLTMNPTKRPEVILCDLYMDEMDGLELINKIRLSKVSGIKDIPVIVLTGDSDKFMHKVVKQVGAKYVMIKPVTADELKRRVLEVIAMARKVAAG